MKDIHVQVDDEIKALLVLYYPGRGALTTLMRRLLKLLVIQLANEAVVDKELIVNTILTEDLRRGLLTPRSKGEGKA